ncbi:pimeloyl-ACP methyl ester esterase BioH [Candidatus Albibeggiatoa sp. nov. NOAA]|uniref:pimeloyl-ACP methyl ester esterase BioH n=1 Tax=Candidatus Albibeggiatoa sp. nov. NOAA TaxID=3162724 RepID=UPI0032FD2024|nr:pimeloyl-ACP methyl ester esterase BioH [Thiotrichaceae bacterium]
MLHISKQGQGQPVVLLHGWGFNHSIWYQVAPYLAQHYQVWQVDLPGHGQSDLCDYELDVLLAQFAETLPKNAIWIGWSLGGLLSMAMARWQPDYVNKLFLIGSSPCFEQKADWPHAMQTEVLQQFGRNLQADSIGTLKRFLALQVKNSPEARQNLRALHQLMETAGYPTLEALQSSLDFLFKTDLRAELNQIQVPSLLCLGTHDALVPIKMAESCQVLWPDLEIVKMRSAAHIPFLSHFDEFCTVMDDFLQIK